MIFRLTTIHPYREEWAINERDKNTKLTLGLHPQSTNPYRWLF